MSKALEALERIEVDMEYVTRLDFVEPIVRGEVQQDLYRIYHREEKDLDIIKKELQALEIIKTKLLEGCFSKEDSYSNYAMAIIMSDDETLKKNMMTEKEYNLLREVLL